jgi:hypothetical protein
LRFASGQYGAKWTAINSRSPRAPFPRESTTNRPSAATLNVQQLDRAEILL